MTGLKVLAAVAVVASVTAANDAPAQEVIYNPGYCAQFYPNANCQNKGPGNPYTGSHFRRGGWHDGYAMMGRPGPRWRHYRHHRM